MYVCAAGSCGAATGEGVEARADFSILFRFYIRKHGLQFVILKVTRVLQSPLQVSSTFFSVFQELYIAKTAAATFCFYALTVTLPNVSYGLVSNNGMPRFLNIVGMAWIGVALQPVIFFATNRKFRVHTTALMCCKEPPDADTTASLRRGSTRTSSSISRPSRISFTDLRTLLGVLPNSIRDKAFFKERSANKSHDNLQTVGEVQEPIVLSTTM